MERRLSGRVLLLWSMLLVVTAGCHSTTYPTGTTTQPAGSQASLPDSVPTPPAIAFGGTGEGWPPRPRGRTGVTTVPTTAIAGAFRETLNAELRTAALQDGRVRTALGERFGYVAAAEIEPDKADPARVDGAVLPVRLTFYSYSNNVAIEVVMSGRGVQTVRPREGYQPPEGAEEIETSIALARRDDRLRNRTEGMGATAIVTERQQGQTGYGHRVLHVSFSPPGADAPQYYALVDLTDARILAAGPVGGY